MAGKHVKRWETWEKVVFGIMSVMMIACVLILGNLMLSIGMSLTTYLLVIAACMAASWVLCWFSDGLNFGFRRNRGKHRR